MDGRVFKLDEEHIPLQPYHVGCRSTTVPVMRPPFDALDKGAQRIARGPGGSELVPADMTYYEWLKTQPAQFQNDAIGPRRAELLRNGGLSAKRFSALNFGRNFQPLTLEEMKRLEPGAFEKVEKSLQKDAADSKLSIMSSQIENRYTGVGVPSDIYNHGKPLNTRQQALLDKLPEYNSRAIVGKDDVSMNDLSVLTAKDGVEFAMFTRGPERLVVGGDVKHVGIGPKSAAELRKQGYKWSGHTHPGDSKHVLRLSEGDRAVLEAFDQNMSVIYNSIGQYKTFTVTEGIRG